MTAFSNFAKHETERLFEIQESSNLARLVLTPHIAIGFNAEQIGKTQPPF